MSTTTSKNSTTPSPTNNKPAVEPAKVPEAASTTTSAPVETVKTEVQATPATAESTNGKVIVSISVEPRLARNARLLAKIRGCTISSLFTDAAAASIPVALKLALADLKEEVE